MIADNLRDLPRPLLEYARSQSEFTLRLYPDCVDALIARAKVALHGDDNTGDALAMAQRALALAPKNTMVLGLNAWILLLESRFRDAHVFIDEHGAAMDDERLAGSYRGFVNLFERDYLGAVAELSAACADRPHAWFARICLGQAYCMAGDAVRALTEFDAVRLSAYDPLAEGELDARFLAEAYALYVRLRFGEESGATASLERLAAAVATAVRSGGLLRAGGDRTSAVLPGGGALTALPRKRRMVDAQSGDRSVSGRSSHGVTLKVNSPSFVRGVLPHDYLRRVFT